MSYRKFLLTLSLIAAPKPVFAQPELKETRVELSALAGTKFKAGALTYQDFEWIAGQVPAPDGKGTFAVLFNFRDEIRTNPLFRLDQTEKGFVESRADRVSPEILDRVLAAGVATQSDGTGKVIVLRLDRRGELDRRYANDGVLAFGSFDPATTRVERFIKPYMSYDRLLLVSSRGQKRIYGLNADGQFLPQYGGREGLALSGGIQDISTRTDHLQVLERLGDGTHRLTALDFETGKPKDVYLDSGRLEIEHKLGAKEPLVINSLPESEPWFIRLVGRMRSPSMAVRYDLDGIGRIKDAEYAALPDYAEEVISWWSPEYPVSKTRRVIALDAQGRAHLVGDAENADRPLGREGEVVLNVLQDAYRITVLTDRARYSYRWK